MSRSRSLNARVIRYNNPIAVRCFDVGSRCDAQHRPAVAPRRGHEPDVVTRPYTELGESIGAYRYRTVLGDDDIDDRAD